MKIESMRKYLEKVFIDLRCLAGTKYGLWLIFLFAAGDSSFLPLPSTTLFMMFSFLDLRKVYKYALFFTFGTLSGAIIGYFIGHSAWINSSGEFTGIAKTIFNNIPGFSEKVYNEIHIMYTKWDYKILLIAVCTPIPYCLFSISSGIFDINIIVFFLVTGISHGIKFLLLANIAVRSNNKIKKLPMRKLRRIFVISAIYIVIVVFVSTAI
jgi:membrane protein YqaA with SNARE-associated domain